MSLTAPGTGEQETRDELERWYAELEANWKRQEEAARNGGAVPQALLDEERELQEVITQMESALPAPVAAAETQVVQTAREEVAETRGRAETLLTRPAPEVVEETAEELSAVLAERLVDAHTVDEMAVRMVATRPDALVHWATHVGDLLTFDDTGLLDEGCDRRMQLWIQALTETKRRYPKLTDFGALTAGEAAIGIRACNQAIEHLQGVLLRHHTADDRPGKRLGFRNKPQLATEGGNTVMRPINRNAARGSWAPPGEDRPEVA